MSIIVVYISLDCVPATIHVFGILWRQNVFLW